MLPFVRWASTQRYNEREYDQTHDDANFDTRQPKLNLTENPNAKIIDGDNEAKQYCYPHTRVDFVTVNPVPIRSVSPDKEPYWITKAAAVSLHNLSLSSIIRDLLIWTTGDY